MYLYMYVYLYVYLYLHHADYPIEESLASVRVCVQRGHWQSTVSGSTVHCGRQCGAPQSGST